MTVTPITRLDAVNAMLSTVGDVPVNSIEGALTPSVAIAVGLLDEVDLETQMRGWHFNTEAEVTLVRNVDQKITFLDTWARVLVSKQKYPALDITTRDDDGALRLYDKKNHTFVLPSDLKAEVVYFVPFEDAPIAYRRYVTTRAARIFQDRTVGSQPHHAYNLMDEKDALRFLKQHEDIVDTRTIFDSWSAARVIARRYPETGWI